MVNKIKIKGAVPTEDQEQNPLPGMPGAEESGGPSSPSIGSESEPGLEVVDPGLAAELVNLPYEAWAIFEKRIPRDQIVLSDNLKQFLGGPVSRVMTKYGLGKIAKDEIVIIITLSAHTFTVISALRKAQPKDQGKPPEPEFHNVVEN